MVPSITYGFILQHQRRQNDGDKRKDEPTRNVPRGNDKARHDVQRDHDRDNVNSAPHEDTDFSEEVEVLVDDVFYDAPSHHALSDQSGSYSQTYSTPLSSSYRSTSTSRSSSTNSFGS